MRTQNCYSTLNADYICNVLKLDFFFGLEDIVLTQLDMFQVCNLIVINVLTIRINCFASPLFSIKFSDHVMSFSEFHYITEFSITWNISVKLLQTFKEGEAYNILCSLLKIFPYFSLLLIESLKGQTPNKFLGQIFIYVTQSLRSCKQVVKVSW